MTIALHVLHREGLTELGNVFILFFLNYNLMKTEMVAGGNSTNLLDACGRDGAAQDPPPSLFGKGFVQGLD